MLAKQSAGRLTREEAEELHPILELDAAERHARQQAEVDRIKADAERAEKEGIAKEKAERKEAEAKRKELLRSKQRVGTLTPGERDELQDMLDRAAAARAAQQPQPAAAASASAGGEGEPQHADSVGGGRVLGNSR